MPPIMPKIKHVVVLMLENRSFDNVLGWLYAGNGNRPLHNVPRPANGTEPTFDGLEKGKHSLPYKYHETKNYPIVKGTCGNGFAVPGLDPWEEYEHVTNQLFGNAKSYDSPTPPRDTQPDMDGFLQDFTTSYAAIKGWSDQIKGALEKLAGKTAGDAVWAALENLPQWQRNLSLQTWHHTLQALQTFTPEQLPVLNGLAREFAVSDRWFSSVPTQTNPNRAFLHCGTSLGMEQNANVHADEHFETDTLWNVLNHYTKDPAHECECSWGIYYQENFPPTGDKCYTGHTFPHIYKIPDANAHFHTLKKFKEQAESGELPDFSFLEPKWGFGWNKDYPDSWGPVPYQQGNDYHPPTSVQSGELFVKEVYDALKAKTEAWEQTLFIITFDEHGGTWDHVPPPWGATSPDDIEGTEHQFKFDRFGVRVPTLLISPYIAEGTVFRSETDVPYDHTSIISTIMKWKGIDPKAPKPGGDANAPWLGKRVANSPTFEGVLTTMARTEKPTVDDPPEERLIPITIKNNTPAQIYAYLGWGPDSGLIKNHKLWTTIWGLHPIRKDKQVSFPGSLGAGESVTYDTSAKTGGPLFDYWIEASYYVGPNSGTPSDLVDSVLGLNKNWRLFWKGWRLITHHETLTISLGKPHAAVIGQDVKGRIRIVNKTLYPIAYHIRYSKGLLKLAKATLPPGQSKDFSTKGYWNYQYILGLKYWTKGFIPGITETWVNFWADWRKIPRNATVTITQDGLQISPPCGRPAGPVS